MTSKPSLFERFALYFAKPFAAHRVSGKISIIEVENPEKFCVLKIDYPGNTIFHSMTRKEAMELVKVIAALEGKDE